jgi:hypothetical protein
MLYISEDILAQPLCTFTGGRVAFACLRVLHAYESFLLGALYAIGPDGEQELR